MPSSSAENKLFQVIHSQLLAWQNELLRGSQAAGLPAIQEYLDSLGLKSTRYGNAGISVDVAGNHRSSKVAALIVEVGGERVFNSSGFAVGLGVTRTLCELKNEMKGKIRVIFQTNNNSGDQPSRLIKQGVLQNVTAIYGLSFDSTVPDGKVGVRFGSILPSDTHFRLRIFSQNGHLSQSNIQVAAQAIIALKQAIARKTDPLKPLSISVTSIHGEESKPTDMDGVLLTGSFHSIDDSDDQHIPEVIENTIQGVTTTYGAGYQFEVQSSFPAVFSDKEVTDNLHLAAERVFGTENLVNLEYPSTNLASFAEYLRRLPAGILQLGTGKHGVNLPPSPPPSADSLHLSMRWAQTLVWALLMHLDKGLMRN